MVRLSPLQGRVAAQGSYQEVQRHPAVAELLAEFNSSGGAERADRPESSSSGADADDDASDTPEVLHNTSLPRRLAQESVTLHGGGACILHEDSEHAADTMHFGHITRHLLMSESCRLNPKPVQCSPTWTTCALRSG